MSNEMMTNVKIVEVTWMHALKVWWSITWRTLLYSFLGGFVVGFILGFIMGSMGVNPNTINGVCRIAGGIISIPIGIAVVKIVLGKKYSDFRIALIAE